MVVSESEESFTHLQGRMHYYNDDDDATDDDDDDDKDDDDDIFKFFIQRALPDSDDRRQLKPQSNNT